MTIRDAAEADHNAIRFLLLATFPDDTEANLVERLRAHKKIMVERVAEDDGTLDGHVVFSSVFLKGQNGEKIQGWGLAPISVTPERQGQGIGSRLIQSALEEARRQKIPYLVVLGDPKYYSRFGFKSADPYGIQCEFDAPPGAFQILPLSLNPIPNGLVQYETEFDAFKKKERQPMSPNGLKNAIYQTAIILILSVGVLSLWGLKKELKSLRYAINGVETRLSLIHTAIRNVTPDN